MARACAFVVLALFSAPAAAEPLTGDVAAALSSAEAANHNPANAGFLDRTQASWAPAIYSSGTTRVRYPGYESVSQSESGMDLLAIPAFIAKLTPRFGIGGFFVPALPMTVDVDKKRIPVMVLRTLSFVDVKGTGQLEGAGQATVGRKLTSSLALGLGATYQSFSFKLDLTPSEGGDALATIDGKISNSDIIAGLRYDLSPGRLSIGLAATLVNIHSESIQISSPLMDRSGDEEPVDGERSEDASQSSVTTPMQSILVGINAALASRFRLLADVRYSRASKSAERMSLVDLKTKPVDAHDTVAPRFATVIGLDSTKNLLASLKYEPASVGPGSSGEGGKSGFGTMELAELWAGFGELTPFWQMSGGIQFGFAPQSEGKQAFYKWTVATGLVYRRASLGIDEYGELPGAYMRTKLFVPVQVAWRM